MKKFLLISIIFILTTFSAFSELNWNVATYNFFTMKLECKAILTSSGDINLGEFFNSYNESASGTITFNLYGGGMAIYGMEYSVTGSDDIVFHGRWINNIDKVYPQGECGPQWTGSWTLENLDLSKVTNPGSKFINVTVTATLISY